MAYELSHHNAWHQYEVEQERKAGEKEAEYRESNLSHLYALSKRRVLTLAEIGEQDANISVVQFVDHLIERAIAAAEEIEHFMSRSHSSGEAL